MTQSKIAGSCISAREGSAVMALITAATESECEIITFSPVAKGRGGVWGGGESGVEIQRENRQGPASGQVADQIQKSLKGGNPAPLITQNTNRPASRPWREPGDALLGNSPGHCAWKRAEPHPMGSCASPKGDARGRDI